MISILEQLVSRQLKCNGLSIQVVVAAPTGLAAFNIGGTTIHRLRLLCLPVEHGKPTDYTGLSQDQLTIIRATLKDLHLLITDEVSMVSSLTLLFTHTRLTDLCRLAAAATCERKPTICADAGSTPWRLATLVVPRCPHRQC